MDELLEQVHRRPGRTGPAPTGSLAHCFLSLRGFLVLGCAGVCVVLPVSDPGPGGGRDCCGLG